MTRLEIEENDLVDTAYVDLLIEKTVRQGATAIDASGIR
jgi:hypothetical protein